MMRGWSADNQPDQQGAGRGRRGVPRADRAAPSRATGALLPDTGILPDMRTPSRRRCWPYSKARRFQGRASMRTWLGSPQPLPQRASLGQPTPGQGVGHPELNREPTQLGEVVLAPAISRCPPGRCYGTCRSAARPNTNEVTHIPGLRERTAAPPPRQRAVLILRGTRGPHAKEVADMLDSSVESVNSALKRARTSLRHRLPPSGERECLPLDSRQAGAHGKFVQAWSAISTRWSRCSPTTSPSPCHHFPSNTRPGAVARLAYLRLGPKV